MAATRIGAPANSLSHPTRRRASSSNQSITGSIGCRLRKSFDTGQRLSIRVSVEGDGYPGEMKKSENEARALELRRVFKGLPRYEFSSGDSQFYPRPLSASDLSKSIKDGSRIRVAYQGVSGAYSESAAEKAYPDCEAVPCEQFDIAFQAVEQWLVDRAVLPIENSLGGSIHRNYDLLLRHRLHIVGEVQFPVRHCLLANHGVRVEDLTRVLSHPQALAQCENTLTNLGVIREAVDDTAGAAKSDYSLEEDRPEEEDHPSTSTSNPTCIFLKNRFVAVHKLKDTAAVASFGAARIYDMNVLAQDIQDDPDNITRFLMLAREPVIPGTDRPFKVDPP
ncbi:Arogenate dehydratase 2 [Sarracenia purpurea var. burkii]